MLRKTLKRIELVFGVRIATEVSSYFRVLDTVWISSFCKSQYQFYCLSIGSIGFIRPRRSNS